MKRFLPALAVVCLMASPALAAHHDHAGGGNAAHETRSVHVQRNNFNRGGTHVSRTVTRSHVTVYRGGHEKSRTITRVNTTRTVHGRTVSRAHTVRSVSGGHVRTNRTVSLRSFRRNFAAPHRYHFGSYRRPSGWYAHRWVYGERLPHAWFAHDYWIGNYVSFGLIAPPDGYEWIRVGDDALLVDVDSGVVLEVEYGVFY